MITKGNNRKLDKAVATLNLTPGVTCPGKTDLCTRVCYGKKARIYKAAVALRAANTLASRSKDFPGALAAEIRALKVDKVRLHEAGDVYDQAYLDALIRVCSDLPAVTFLMYTKSFHLDFTGKPKNLKLYWSVDSTSPTPAPPGPTAYLVAKGEAIPPGRVTCVHTKETHYCGSECTTCWDGAVDVYFLQH